MHSDADVNRSLSRDPCWTFRSQSSVFYFLESLDFPTVLSWNHRWWHKNKAIPFSAKFFFSGSSHFGENYQRKSFIKYHLHKKSRAYTLYTFRGQILRKWPWAISPKMSSRFSKFREHGCSIKCSKQFAILIQNLHQTKPAMQLWRSKVPAGLSFHSGFLFILCT